jgi:hypothetical protein
MNFGGVGGRYSTLESWYSGFRGFEGWRQVKKRWHYGFDFSISEFDRLYSGLLSSKGKWNVIQIYLTEVQSAASRPTYIPILPHKLRTVSIFLSHFLRLSPYTAIFELLLISHHGCPSCRGSSTRLCLAASPAPSSLACCPCK